MKQKSKEVQTLEQRWELLKFEIEQLEDFYSRVDADHDVEAIQSVQRIISDLESESQ